MKMLTFFSETRKKYLSRFARFCEFLAYYLKKKVIYWSILFEKNKNILVKLFTIKRGRYSRPFLHAATMGVLSLGVAISPFLADTFPIFASRASETFETSSIT